MRTLCTILFLFLAFFSSAQQNFLINEGNAGSDEEFYHTAQTKDGNYVVVGYTDKNDPFWDILIFKVDINGIRLWTKTISGNGYDEAFGVTATSDGGFAVSGSLNDKMTLLKFDAAGNLLWHKEYAELYRSDASRILQTDDGGFLLPGFISLDENDSNINSYLLKTDASGNVEWSKKYFTNAEHSLIYDIKKTVDGNYTFLANNSGSNDTTCVVKINSSGDVIWARYFFDDQSYTEGYSLAATPDGGCVVAGMRYNNTSNAFLLKLNSIGTKMWSKTTNSDGAAELAFYTCVIGPTGGYTFMGAGSAADSNFYYLMLTNNAGELTWTKTIKKADNDFYGTYYSILGTSEGGYLVAGSVLDASGFLDGALLKLDVNFNNCKPFTGVFGSLVDYGTMVAASITAVPGNTVVSTESFSTSATTNNVLACTALPLNLASFTAIPQNNKVLLQWKTSQETNTSYFDVERSQDGKGFSAFKQLSAAGNSNIPLSYTTTDDQPFSGKSWYRLKMVDKDGAYAYSTLAAVTLDFEKGFSITPNPVGNTLNLYIQGTIAANARLQITDMNGRLLLQNKAFVSAGSNSIKLDVSRFVKGVYFIKIIEDKAIKTLKWVKQ